MNALLACFLSSVVVALALTIYSAAENGVRVEMLGVALIAFLYAAAVACAIGLPFRYVARKLGKTAWGYYAGAGSIVGSAFTIVPLAMSRWSDPSLVEITIVLAVSGFLAGCTFHRIANA